MTTTYKKNKEGLYEIFQNGKRISTTSSREYAEDVVDSPNLGSGGTQSLNEDGGLPGLPSEDEAVQDFTKMNVALNKAVDLARQKRKDTTLDMVGGAFEPGTLPASSFASVVDAFNSSSAPIESELLGSAVDFQQQQADQVEQTRQQIQELGVSLIEQGAKAEDVKTVLRFTESGDLNGALTAAAGVLEGTSKDYEKTYSIDGKIVGVDKDGNSNVIYDGGGGTPTPSGNGLPTGGDAVFQDSETGNTYNLGTTQGIKDYKADNPDVQDADIKAYLDENTGLNKSTIDGLFEEGSSLDDAQVKAYARGLVKNFFSPESAFFQGKGTEDQIALDNAKAEAVDMILGTGGKIRIKDKGEIQLTDEQRQLLINELSRLSAEDLQ